MYELFYVPTDAKGVEHATSGHIAWKLPSVGVARATETGRPLLLRRSGALVDVLDERVHSAVRVAPATSQTTAPQRLRPFDWSLKPARTPKWRRASRWTAGSALWARRATSGSPTGRRMSP